MLEPLADPSFWKAQWDLFWAAPLIVLPLVFAVGALVWWFRGKLVDREVSALRAERDTWSW